MQPDSAPPLTIRASLLIGNSSGARSRLPRPTPKKGRGCNYGFDASSNRARTAERARLSHAQIWSLEIAFGAMARAVSRCRSQWGQPNPRNVALGGWMAGSVGRTGRYGRPPSGLAADPVRGSDDTDTDGAFRGASPTLPACFPYLFRMSYVSLHRLPAATGPPTFRGLRRRTRTHRLCVALESSLNSADGA